MSKVKEKLESILPENEYQEDPQRQADQQQENLPAEIERQNRVTLNDEVANPFEEVGRQAPRRIVGDLLRFSKGDYLYGQDNAELPLNTRLIANMDQLLKGWIRWEDNKPAEQIMGLVVEGYKPPRRDTLGFGYTPGVKDPDTSEWEVDEASGQSRDPWQETYYLLVRELDKDGQPKEGEEGLYTFTTATTGGKDAIIDLCAKYGKWMRVHTADYPVITLKMEKYNHPNKKYGVIKKPKFEFNPKKDWIAKDRFGEISDVPPDDGEEIPF